MRKPYNVMTNWHFNQLEKRCADPISAFSTEGEVVNTPNGMYVYKDRGADILAVAHLDTVQQEHHFYLNGPLLRCPQLDDRLGAFVILDLLSDLNYDILLTEGEEKGRSTAQHFRTEKRYKWMFEFDRTGTDVVMYQYDCPEFRRKLEEVKMTPGNGSISDISYLSHLKCRGMNVGVGYYNYHSLQSYARLDHMLDQTRLFRDFYFRNKDVYLDYLPKCKNCNETEGLNKYGYCQKHSYTTVPSKYNRQGDWSYYNSGWSRYDGDYESNAHDWQKKSEEKWTEYDWDGWKNDPPLPQGKSAAIRLSEAKDNLDEEPYEYLWPL